MFDVLVVVGEPHFEKPWVKPMLGLTEFEAQRNLETNHSGIHMWLSERLGTGIKKNDEKQNTHFSTLL